MSSSRRKHDLIQRIFSKCITEVKSSFPFLINLVLEKVTGDKRVEGKLMLKQADNYLFTPCEGEF